MCLGSVCQGPGLATTDCVVVFAFSEVCSNKMATLRSNDYLVSCAEGIDGCKLPSGKQALGHFLHRHSILKEEIRTAANNTIIRVEEFWSHAKIPVKHRQDSIKKIEQLFHEWQGLKKNKNRKTKTQQDNEAKFSEMLQELFDIAHADAMNLITTDEDKLFLQSQRQKGRPGCMMGVDTVLLLQQQQRKERDEKLQKRRERSEREKKALSETLPFDTDSDSSCGHNSSSSSELDDESDIVPSTSTASSHCPPRKRGRQQVISAPLAAMLDRNLLSDRAAMMIVFESARTLGQDPTTLALNRSTIQRERRKHRKAAAVSIKEEFKPNTALTVHWDGKLMPDLTGKEKVDRLPILVSTMGEKKLLEIPKTSAGTGTIEAHAVYNAIRDWGLENLVRAMCFDTTSANTGRLSGACIILEQLLGRSLLHFGCRHHIMELVLGSAFLVCMGPSKAPEILLFKRFQEQWPYIDQDSFSDVFSDDVASTALANVRDDIIAFCEQQLQVHQPRDDYRELLKLMLIFLGGMKSPDHMPKFRAPGPMHQARWMAKAIYSIKVWLFRSQFKLTQRESHGLLRLNIFLAKIYIKFWFQAPVAVSAARNDLQLLKMLHSYPDRDISKQTSCKMAGHLWYLSEDLVLLSLFDPELDSATKRALVKGSEEHVGETDPPKRPHIEMASVQQKTLVDFVSKSSRKLFEMLGLPSGFLAEDPETWNSRDDYKAAAAIVKALAVTNDHAERGVALIQDAAQSGRFRCEEQLQYALHVIEHNREQYPDAKKSTLLRQSDCKTDD